MDNIIKKLKTRGYIEQMTDEEGLINEVENKKITFYFGVDPTADSLHVGHLVIFTVARHMQLAGHKPIILVGGATGTIGDPSAKQEMRKLLSQEELDKNIAALKKQAQTLLDFTGENAAILVDNATWTSHRTYIDFLRTIGRHFNVNQMLGAECYKARLKEGLTFFELGYMLMQANDFKHLFETENCILQLGGNDQWSNLIAGVDLIRKANQEKAYTASVKLLTTKDGKKMGKTEKGALWLDKEKTTPYEFYQYFRNIGDEDIELVMRMLTLIETEEIERLLKEEKNPNKLKEILAFHMTERIHGTEEAKKAEDLSISIFQKGISKEGLPTIDAEVGEDILNLSIKAGFVQSRGQAKKLIEQGGITLNDEKIEISKVLEKEDLNDNEAILKKGKKNIVRVIVK